ncbi:MAG: GTP cyclohydrolase FolE2 [Qingshengfaniella sp.]
MNMHTPTNTVEPTREDAEEALALLRRWADTASAADRERLDARIGQLSGGTDAAPEYPDFSRNYPESFTVTPDYKDALPDLQNGPSSLIRGARTQIQHVGISNFRLPIRFHTRDGSDLTLETSVTGTVSLEAEKKGINMSRIMRTFYAQAEQTFSFDVMAKTINAYKTDLDSFDARLMMRFSFPMKVDSLRSGLAGYQYYDIALELVETAGTRLQIMHLDYVYSSTCPCSLELSEHARRSRNQLATPHSQRSVARVSVVVEPHKWLWYEDMIDLCRAAVPTETQVMVKREDEQAFAELNAANPIFVEDAARSFCDQLRKDPRIGDFRVVASHQESLHSHDAVSVLTEGSTFAADSLDPQLFATLIHRG